MRRQKQQHVLWRPICLESPIYFNEKMMWLKYYLYNYSPIIAQCYNKYTVREYIKSKGLECILNELYGVWDSVEQIPWDSLPEEYVIKWSNGYAGHVFKRINKPFSKKDAIKELKATKRRCTWQFQLSGGLFVYGTQGIFICEKLLHSNKGYESPEDYKFFCFHGVPMFLLYISNRRYDNGKMRYDQLFIDLKTMKNRPDLEAETNDVHNFELPQSFEKMLSIAAMLSADFPFVRVDFYEINEKPIFGELTFTPFYAHTPASLTEMGKLIHLENLDKYRKLLKVV